MLGATLCFGVEQEARQTDCLMKPTLVIRKMPDLREGNWTAAYLSVLFQAKENVN